MTLRPEDTSLFAEQFQEVKEGQGGSLKSVYIRIFISNEFDAMNLKILKIYLDSPDFL